MRDPWVNLLRVTAAAFAAGIGGAGSVTTAAFDSELGEPDELGRRMARNTQLLLQEESNVGRVVDPAGGSWYVESLTDQIAVAAWAPFGELESGGGMPAVLLDGSLAERASPRSVTHASRGWRRRKEPITGVSEFADIGRGAPRRDRARPAHPALACARARAPVVSASARPPSARRCPGSGGPRSSKRLRDASDGYLAATGARPKVFLVNLGPVAVHTARATFAKNFFEAGRHRRA